MRILVSNDAGLNDTTKRHVAMCKARNYDITLFVETKLGYRTLPGLRAKWGNRSGVFMAACDGARRGVVTLFSEKLAVEHFDDASDDEGQFQINIFRCKGCNYMLVTYYGDPDLDLNAMNTIGRLNLKMDDMLNRFRVIIS